MYKCILIGSSRQKTLLSMNPYSYAYDCTMMIWKEKGIDEGEMKKELQHTIEGIGKT